MDILVVRILASLRGMTGGRRWLTPGFRDALTLAGATAASQGLLLALSPVLTRIYDPADFGILATYAAAVGILATVASLRYDLAVSVAPDWDTAAALAKTAIVTAFITSALFELAVIAVRDANTIETIHMGYWIHLIAPTVFLVAGYQTLTYWGLRGRAFSSIARTRATQAAAGAFVQVGLGLAGMGAGGLVLGSSVGQWAGTLTLSRSLQAHLRESRALLNRSALVAVARRYRRFALLSAPAALAGSAGLLIPAILIAVIYGTAVAGLYGLADRVLRIPLALVGTSVGQVYLARFSEARRLEPERLRSLFLQTSRRLFGVGAFVLIPLGFAAPATFELIFGPHWRGAGTIVALMVPMAFAQFVVGPVSQTMNLLNRQGTVLVLDSGRLIAVVGVFAFGHASDAVYTSVITALSVSMVVLYAIYWACSLRALASLEA